MPALVVGITIANFYTWMLIDDGSKKVINSLTMDFYMFLISPKNKKLPSDNFLPWSPVLYNSRFVPFKKVFIKNFIRCQFWLVQVT